MAPQLTHSRPSAGGQGETPACFTDKVTEDCGWASGCRPGSSPLGQAASGEVTSSPSPDGEREPGDLPKEARFRG